MQVQYMDHMGSDLTVVNAARTSFDKESRDYEIDVWDTPDLLVPIIKVNGKDEGLINYLAEHHHWLPFRHPTVMFRCKAPIFVARQAVKHQVGMSWSEVSRRYVDSPPEFYTPEVWRKRAIDKKQGSIEETINEPAFMRTAFNKLVSYYNEMLDDGVAPEMARMILPQSMYTEWVWTGTLLSWAHFVKQRTEEHAQKEIQEFASLFIPTLEKLYPVSWAALMKHYVF